MPCHGCPICTCGLNRSENPFVPNRLPSKQALVLFIILGIAAAIGLGAYFLQSTAQQILIVQSERTAFAWARYLAAELPRIEAVAEGAELTPEEERFLNGVRKFGNIFRFKLFDRNGNLRLVSDDLRTNYSKTAGGTPDHSATSRIVVATGRPVTELQDGTEKPDRPDTYSETYIPVYRDNTLVAVSEVYIDKTQLASDVMRDFLAFGDRKSVV